MKTFKQFLIEGYTQAQWDKLDSRTKDQYIKDHPTSKYNKSLSKTEFPGGYYNQDGRLEVYFKSRKEKEDFDNDSRNDKRSENWIYRSDKDNKLSQVKAKSLLSVNKGVQAVSNAVDKLLPKDVVSHIIKQSFGDNLVSQKAVDTINNSGEFIKEIGLTDEQIEKLDKLIDQYEYNKLIKDELLEIKKKQQERKAELKRAYKNYQDKNYV